MIEVPTVLVLGAGASIPYGFPSGQVLADLICLSLLSKNRPFPSIPRELEHSLSMTFGMLKQTFDVNELAQFALHLSGEESVDAFLEHQTKDFIDIGKAAIAAALLPFEDDGALDQAFMVRRLMAFFPGERQARVHTTGGNWYQLLWRAMNAPFERFGENLLKIITFNYDRSLEHYLYSRISKRYPNKDEGEYMTKMPYIAHIHGRLGYLPWQEVRETQHVPYGAIFQASSRLKSTLDPASLRKWFDAARKDITVIHEAQETDELNKARQWIHNCQRLYFLGFGYHPSNIARLKIESMKKKRIYGTVSGLSKARKEYVKDTVQRQNTIDFHGSFFEDDVYTFLHDRVILG